MCLLPAGDNMATVSKMGSEGENEGEHVLCWREINDMAFSVLAQKHFR